MQKSHKLYKLTKHCKAGPAARAGAGVRPAILWTHHPPDNEKAIKKARHLGSAAMLHPGTGPDAICTIAP